MLIPAVLMGIYQAGGVTVATPAKLNLVLDVLGRRPDGYHEIRSLVAPVSLYDLVRIDLVRGGGITTSLRAVAIPNGSVVSGMPARDNLATRAAEIFYAASGIEPGCRIAIRKKIPVGAGLGGGSADAAGVLHGLNTLHGKPFSRPELAELGSRIGSDVPALAWGGPVWMSGRGEKLEPFNDGLGKPERPVWLVLLNPGFIVPTADIYRRWNPGLTLPDQKYKKAGSFLMAGDCRGLGDCLWNSLQKVAFTKYPALALLAEALREAGAREVLLAGSGGTVFGLASSRAEAREVRRGAVKRLDSSVWSRVVKTMPDGVMVAHGPLEARV